MVLFVQSKRRNEIFTLNYMSNCHFLDMLQLKVSKNKPNGVRTLDAISCVLVLVLALYLEGLNSYVDCSIIISFVFDTSILHFFEK